MPPPYRPTGIGSWNQYQSRPTGPSNINLGIRTARPQQNGYGNPEGTPGVTEPALSGYTAEAPHNTYASAHATPYQIDQHQNSGRIGLPGQPLPGPGPDFMAQARLDPSHTAFMAKANAFEGEMPRSPMSARTSMMASNIRNPSQVSGTQSGIQQARQAATAPDMQGISQNQPANAPGQSAPGQQGPAPVSNSFTGVSPARYAALNMGGHPGPAARRIGMQMQPRLQAGPGTGEDTGQAPNIENTPEFQRNLALNSSLYGRVVGRQGALAMTHKQMQDEQGAAKERSAKLGSLKADTAHNEAQARLVNNQASISPAHVTAMELMKHGHTAESAMSAALGMGLSSSTGSYGEPLMARGPTSSPAVSGPMASGPPVGATYSGLPPTPVPGIGPDSQAMALAKASPGIWLGQNSPQLGAMVGPDSGISAADALKKAQGNPAMQNPVHAAAFAAGMAGNPGGLNPMQSPPIGLQNADMGSYLLSRLLGYGTQEAPGDQANAIDFTNQKLGTNNPLYAPPAPGVYGKGLGWYDPMGQVPGAINMMDDRIAPHPDYWVDPNAASSAEMLRRPMPKGKANPFF